MSTLLGRLTGLARPLPKAIKARSADALVVDGDDELRRRVVRAFASAGAECVEAGSFPEMRTALKVYAPTLLVVDLSLGRHDAFDVLEFLRREEFEGSVVLISGHDQNTLDHVRRIGVGYGLTMLEPVRKPLSCEALQRLTKPCIPDVPVMSIDFDRVLDQNQLEVWYQPKVSLEHYAPVGFEALVRVRHPQRGLLLPSAFLGELSERQMGRLTERVVRRVVEDWQSLAEDGFFLKPSVNIRARDLADPRLVDLLRGCVPQVRHWPGLLLELNETRLLDDIHAIRDTMVRLRLHSIEFAIDDFGSLLRDPSGFRVPLSELNVDRRFVHGCASDPQKRTICKAAAQIARKMKVLSVAEGLETPADMQCVKDLGFDLAQGNLFSPAVTLEDLRRMHYAILYPDAVGPNPRSRAHA